MTGKKQAEITGVVSPKGGVGKSTAALTIASICAGLLNKKTLLIDSDGQCTATKRLRDELTPDRENTLYGVITGESKTSAVIQKSKFENLFLLPSHPKLLKLTSVDYPPGLIPQMMLRTVIDPIAAHFDHIIVDSPGFFGDILSATICSAHHLLVPIGLEDDNLGGLDTIKSLVLTLSENNLTRLSSPIRAFFYNMPPPSDLTKIQQETIEKIRFDYKNEYTGIAIPRSDGRIVASNNTKTTLYYAFPKSSVTKKYIELTNQIT